MYGLKNFTDVDRLTVSPTFGRDEWIFNGLVLAFFFLLILAYPVLQDVNTLFVAGIYAFMLLFIFIFMLAQLININLFRGGRMVKVSSIDFGQKSNWILYFVAGLFLVLVIFGVSIALQTLLYMQRFSFTAPILSLSITDFVGKIGSTLMVGDIQPWVENEFQAFLLGSLIFFYGGSSLSRCLKAALTVSLFMFAFHAPQYLVTQGSQWGSYQSSLTFQSSVPKCGSNQYYDINTNMCTLIPYKPIDIKNPQTWFNLQSVYSLFTTLLNVAIFFFILSVADIFFNSKWPSFFAHSIWNSISVVIVAYNLPVLIIPALMLALGIFLIWYIFQPLKEEIQTTLS